MDWLAIEHQFWWKLAAAVCCGGLLGLERQLRGKVVGVRTSILIALGTMVFVFLGANLGEHADPARVVGQVVTGIGFLGTGVILARGGQIIGVTTAALIWVLAAVGSAIGLGRMREAFALTLVTLVVVVGLEWLEQLIARMLHYERQDEVED